MSRQPCPFDHLTPRELDALRLVILGLSAKEIAGRLGIGWRTVDKHIESIKLKLRARNRSHMVGLALAAGLVEPGSFATMTFEATAQAAPQSAAATMKQHPSSQPLRVA